MRIALLVLGLLAGLAPAYGAERGARFQNLDQIIEGLNLRSYFLPGAAPVRALKVAVFDNGFRGAREEIGRGLPSTTRIIDVPQPEPDPGREESHGFFMSRILWSVLSKDGRDLRYRPRELLLYNVSGYTNLEFAVNDAVKRGVEVILFSEVWDYGGNFDGRGWINAVVKKATDTGVLWINSSGNSGALTFNAPIRTGANDLVELAAGTASLEIRCRKTPLKVCPFRATLSWNDFTDDINAGTVKDLDFALFDANNQLVQSSFKRQGRKAKNDEGSVFPRETITGQPLLPGRYTLRVKNRSHNFGAKDRLRITVQGEFLTMLSADRRESLLIPADQPGVIAVGASDSEQTGVSAGRRKPELHVPSLVSLSARQFSLGTSNSAAMVAAAAVILKAHFAGLTREGFLRAAAAGARANGAPGTGRGLGLGELGFRPTGRGGCFRPVTTSDGLPDAATYAASLGGQVVETTAGLKVLYPFDPIRVLREGIRRTRRDDALAMTDEGSVVLPREAVDRGPEGSIELAELPFGQRICSGNDDSWRAPSWSTPFSLPNLHGYGRSVE